MNFEIWGIDLVDFFLRGGHAFMAAAWLLFDFLVFWLHFGVKDESRPLASRIERARIMHGIDTVVAYIFILMLPTGIALCFITDTPLFTTAWLNWKHVLYAIIILCAFVLFPVSGLGLRNLEAIRDGAENVDELNEQIRKAMTITIPVVMVIWVLIAVITVLSVLHLKAPEGQEYIFRKTAVEQGG